MMYTPTTDVYEEYKDGSGRVCVAQAGVPMQIATAIELGLVNLPVQSEGIIENDPKDSEQSSDSLSTGDLG